MENSKDIAIKIIENLSPVLGCKPTSKKWNPRAGSIVCKGLRLSSLLCLDIEKDNFKNGKIEYSFDNAVSIKTAGIYKLALRYSPLIFDDSYSIQMQDEEVYLSDLADTIFLQSLSKKYNDSAIIDIVDNDRKIVLSEFYKHLLLITLQCFSLRLSLYEYAYENMELEYAELNERYIGKIINNIIYLRKKLEDEDIENNIELMNHLQLLLLNIKMVNKLISQRYR